MRKYFLESNRLGISQWSEDDLEIEALFAGHNPNNKSSEILLKRLGFKYTHHEFYEPTGLEHPSYILNRE